MDWVLRHTQVKTSLFSSSGRGIGEVGSELEITKTLVVISPKVCMVFCQIDLNQIAAVVVGSALVFFSFPNIPLLLAIVPFAFGFPYQTNMPMADWFSKQVVRLDFNRSILIGQVVGAVWLGRYSKRRKLVSADFDRG